MKLDDFQQDQVIIPSKQLLTLNHQSAASPDEVPDVPDGHKLMAKVGDHWFEHEL